MKDSVGAVFQRRLHKALMNPCKRTFQVYILVCAYIQVARNAANLWGSYKSDYSIRGYISGSPKK